MVTVYAQFKPIRQQCLQHRLEFPPRRRFRGWSNSIYIEQFGFHPGGLIGDEIIHSVLEFKNISRAHCVVESNRLEDASPKWWGRYEMRLLGGKLRVFAVTTSARTNGARLDRPDTGKFK